MKTSENCGRKQTPATKRAIARAMTGSKNPAWKDGRRASRRIAGAKTNDKSIVHHVDGDSKNNKKSNLKKIPKAQRSKHEKIHERGKNFSSGGGTKKIKRGYVAKRLKKRKA
ncbi:hypothetical protein LCGC14_3133560 [marine sediment metagenome]|uniref:Nuclease associated modular domain-containing protein n=1 Tax=marine sediment metagenome TaxID=412755 RepID=A0A0F8VYZ9_9ZZZZ